VKKEQRNLVTTNRRLDGTNIIAGLCSTGELLYTVNIGITNGHTFGFFLTKLFAHLDGEDPRWRENTVLMLDNANYHRNLEVMEIMRKLRLPVLFLGPYHFRLAPVEMVFNFIKGHDLNPLRTTGRSR